MTACQGLAARQELYSEPIVKRAFRAHAWAALQVEVLKVPHHGSRYQDLPWLLAPGARLAVASMGADNDYGHPSAGNLGPWKRPSSRCFGPVSTATKRHRRGGRRVAGGGPWRNRIGRAAAQGVAIACLVRRGTRAPIGGQYSPVVDNGSPGLMR